MGRKKSRLILIICTLIFFLVFPGFMYYHKANLTFNKIFTFFIDLFQKFCRSFKILKVKLIYSIRQKLFPINNFIDLFKTTHISKSDIKIKYLDQKLKLIDNKIKLLKEFGIKYDEIVLNTMLYYFTNGIPIESDMIINIYIYTGLKEINLKKFPKYHFKILEITKYEYEKLEKENFNEIGKTYNNNLKSNAGNKLYIVKYKLTLKNSKPAILAQLRDEEDNIYFALIENLPNEIVNLPEDFRFYYKNAFPKIQYQSFYFYPLSSSMDDVIIGFYAPINPFKIISFFAIIFIIVIILLVFGFLLLKQYIFNSFSSSMENKNFEKKDSEMIKKMEKTQNINNNIVENENNVKEGENKESVGKPVDINEIPEINDF